MKSCVDIDYGREEYCFDCRFSRCSEDWNHAPGCCLRTLGINRAVAAKLQAQTDKSNEEKGKINEENKRLTEKNKKYADENIKLSSRIARIRHQAKLVLQE